MKCARCDDAGIVEVPVFPFGTVPCPETFCEASRVNSSLRMALTGQALTYGQIVDELFGRVGHLRLTEKEERERGRRHFLILKRGL